MQFHFSFKHMASSSALESYAEEKFREKIERFVTKPIEAFVVFDVTKHLHRGHLRLKAGDGFSADVEHVCEDMYATVDQMADKLEAQLRKHKEILKDHRPHNGPRDIRELFEDDEDEEQAVDASEILRYERGRRRMAR
jgi:putative sigma-54 modulation protein